MNTCYLLQGCIAFIDKYAYVCCLTNHEGGGFIKLIDDYESEKINWDDVFQTKKELLDSMQSGIIPQKCKGCSHIIDIDESQKINYQFWGFNIAPFVPCNCQCIYCDIWQKSPQKDINFAPIIQAMYDKNLIVQNSSDSFMGIGGGEPLLIKDFDDLLHTSVKCGIHKFYITTNGILFSSAITDVMDNKNVNISVIISLDSGNSALYKKIKNVDCFDKVVENIKKYIKYQNENSLIKTKYIIIPQINDTDKDIMEWYNLSKNIGIKTIVLDVERNWFANSGRLLPKKYTNLINLIKENAKKDNIQVEYFESLQNYMANVN